MTVPFKANSQIVDAIVHNPLYLPGKKPVFEVFTIAGGQTLPMGAVLGMITSSGKLTLALSASSDGSQTPMAVLPQPVATFAADGSTNLDMSMSVIVEGYLNGTALVFGTGLSLTTAVKAILRDAGIHTRSPGYSG